MVQLLLLMQLFPLWMALLLLLQLLKPLLLVTCLLVQKCLAKRQLRNHLLPLLMQLLPPLRLLPQMLRLPLNRSLLKVLLHRPKVSNSDPRRNANEEREALASLFLCFKNWDWHKKKTTPQREWPIRSC
jgi:hypothetical protein